MDIKPVLSPFERSLRFEPDTQAFAKLLAGTPAAEQLASLASVTSDSRLIERIDLAAKNFPAKTELLYDALRKTHPMETQELMIRSAAKGNPEIFGFLMDKAGPAGTAKLQERAFLEAIGAGETLPDDEQAGKNLGRLLTQYAPAPDALFSAMRDTIKKGEAPQAVALIQYAASKHPELVQQADKKGATLFDTLFAARRARAMTVELADRVAGALLDAGAIPPQSVDGTDVITYLEHERFGHYTQRKTGEVLAARGALPQRPGPEEIQPRERWALEPKPKAQVTVTTVEDERKGGGWKR